MGGPRHFEPQGNRVLLETGTFDCQNARMAAQNYDHVHTIDHNQERSAGCGSDIRNLTAHTGESPQVLAKLLNTRTDACDFYLDAHADIMPGAPQDSYDAAAPGSSIVPERESLDNYMPLLRECEVISRHNKGITGGGHYVCIDDVRCWENDACPASELWRRAGITTQSIIDAFDGQVVEHQVDGDVLCLQLR